MHQNYDPENGIINQEVKNLLFFEKQSSSLVSRKISPLK